MLIDDFSREDMMSALQTNWRPVSDRVMGGISQAGLGYDRHLGRGCLHLHGDVCLDNDGGFIQMALDLASDGDVIDAGAFRGVCLHVLGNDERYSVHLRTDALTRSWQSYRTQFIASREWSEIRLPFTAFSPHRVEIPLDVTRLRRLGLVAIGRPFRADLRLARVEFYK
ncbi:MAG: CIA30 family protein [Chromatiales bacterium]|nr:CIA30 family protein [Chromatiales bacterium]